MKARANEAPLTDEGFLPGLHVLPPLLQTAAPRDLYPRLSANVPPLPLPPFFLPFVAVMS